MKTLLSTLAVVGVLFSTNTLAQEKGSVEEVTAALLKQQNVAVSQAVEHQVNLDIKFALRAMQMPSVEHNETMLAKVEAKKSQDSE